MEVKQTERRELAVEYEIDIRYFIVFSEIAALEDPVVAHLSHSYAHIYAAYVLVLAPGGDGA